MVIRLNTVVCRPFEPIGSAYHTLIHITLGQAKELLNFMGIFIR